MFVVVFVLCVVFVSDLYQVCVMSSLCCVLFVLCLCYVHVVFFSCPCCVHVVLMIVFMISFDS